MANTVAVDQSEASSEADDQSEASIVSDTTGETSSQYEADNECSGNTAVVSNSTNSGAIALSDSVQSLSLGSTNADHLNEAMDMPVLLSEPSDPSLVANLHEAIDCMLDDSLTAKGIWKPLYVPEFLRGVVVGGASAEKRPGGDFVNRTALKKARNDTVEVDLVKALNDMRLASLKSPAPVHMPVSLDVELLGNMLSNMCLCTERYQCEYFVLGDLARMTEEILEVGCDQDQVVFVTGGTCSDVCSVYRVGRFTVVSCKST